MKKKLFKYKFVYWVSILLSFALLIFFNYATLLGVKRISGSNNFKFNLFQLVILLIDVSSVVSFFHLIFKNEKSMIVFSFNLLLVISLLAYAFISPDSFMKTKSDLFIGLFFLFILRGHLFLIQKYKHKPMIYSEIDEIGKPK